jgi:REP element-mobilizing transposase RayT
MNHDSGQRRRRSIRLPAYDYAQAGAYFVTIVCKDRVPLLQEPEFRAAADEAWRWLADRYEFVELDEYVVMPNHLHGIIVVVDPRRGGSRTAPTNGPKRKALGRLVGAFKTVSTKRINGMRGTPGLPVWQRNYYEHVVRDEEDLDAVRQYIVNNPMRWAEDRDNPGVAGSGNVGAGPCACPQ